MDIIPSPHSETMEDDLSVIKTSLSQMNLENTKSPNIKKIAKFIEEKMKKVKKLGKFYYITYCYLDNYWKWVLCCSMRCIQILLGS